MQRILFALALLVLPVAAFAQDAPVPAASVPAAPAPPPQVLLHTSMGDITLLMYPDKSPKSVANFLQYVRDGFYDGTVFHRVIDGYLIQGGLYTRELTAKRTRTPVQAEADNGLSNLRGTIAVARGADPDSGTAQFFINLVDNRRLDFTSDQSGLTWGYTVFGKVIKGMDVVDRIARLPTHAQGPFAGDVPRPLVIIDSARVIGEAAPASAASTAPAAKPASTSKHATAKPAAKPAAKKKA